MPSQMADKRTSERVVPMVTDEEMVVIESDGRHILAKLMDLSETGTLVYYLMESDAPPEMGAQCTLSLYHHGTVFAMPAVVARRMSRLIAFHFTAPPEDLSFLQAKLIRMEVEWNRLRLLV